MQNRRIVTSPSQGHPPIWSSLRGLPPGVWGVCGVNLLLWIVCVVTMPPHLDEIGSWGMAQGTLSQVFEQTIYSQGQGPVYFVLLSNWISLLGDSIVSLRGFSLICSLLTTLIIATVARTLKGDRFATAVVWFYACMPWVACFSPLARPYALANLLLGALLLSAVQFSRSQRGFSLGIGAVLSALVFLTQSLYALALPFSALLVWFGANPSSRLRASLSWLVSLGVAQAIVIAAYFSIISGHVGTLAQLAYLPDPTLNDLGGQLFICSALGLAALMVLSTSLIFRISRPLFSETCNRSFLIGNVIAAVVPIVTLWAASNVFSVTLFTARYLMLTAPFSALAAATLVHATPFHRLNLVSALLLGVVGLADTGVRLIREGRLQAQLAEELTSVDVSHCPLFASTGYVDLQIPERVEDRRMYSFLSAPVTYYKKTDVHLMPNSLDQEPARRYFEEKVLPELLGNSCVTVVAFNMGFSAANVKLNPYASRLREELQKAGFSVSLQIRQGAQSTGFVVMKAEKPVAS